MSYLVVIIISVTLGVSLAHSSALKTIKQSIETDLAALHAKLDALKEKL